MNGWGGAGGRESAGVRGVLRELVRMLQALLRDEEPSHIDLVALELAESERAQLRDALGEGEIVAEVRNFGRVSVVQCGYAGVWWVTHMDEEGEVLSEFLEVSYCPEVLITEMEAVADGRHALQARLFELELGNKHG